MAVPWHTFRHQPSITDHSSQYCTLQHRLCALCTLAHFAQTLDSDRPKGQCQRAKSVCKMLNLSYLILSIRATCNKPQAAHRAHTPQRTGDTAVSGSNCIRLGRVHFTKMGHRRPGAIHGPVLSCCTGPSARLPPSGAQICPSRPGAREPPPAASPLHHSLHVAHRSGRSTVNSTAATSKRPCCWPALPCRRCWLVLLREARWPMAHWPRNRCPRSGCSLAAGSAREHIHTHRVHRPLLFPCSSVQSIPVGRGSVRVSLNPWPTCGQ